MALRGRGGGKRKASSQGGTPKQARVSSSGKLDEGSKDQRWMFNRPVPAIKIPKSQLARLTAIERIKPRASTGTSLPEGTNEIFFDIPPQCVLLASPHNRLDIIWALQKALPAAPNTWVKCDPEDCKDVLLAQNFLSYAFTDIDWYKDYKPMRMNYFASRGMAPIHTFILSHTAPRQRLQCCTTSLDPANCVHLKKDSWTYKPAAGTNKWSEFGAATLTKNTFTSSYRPPVFPFQTGPPCESDVLIIPPLEGAKLSLGLTLDLPYHNVIASKAGTTKYRFVINTIELVMDTLKVTPYGDSALRYKSGMPLIQFPGDSYMQFPSFISANTRAAVFQFENVMLPKYLLIQSFSSDLFTGKASDEKERTVPQALNISEIILRYDEDEFFTSSTANMFDLDNKDATVFRRRDFFLDPFFKMKVCDEVGQGVIENYSQEHLLFKLTDGSSSMKPMLTLGANQDPVRGKFYIELKSKENSGLQQFYLFTFIYPGQGVILNRMTNMFYSPINEL